MSEVKIVFGLGNPGSKYEGTRHNVGFETLDLLAQQNALSFTREKKWFAEICKLGSTYLVKPLTFMNDSGKSVRALTDYFSLSAEQILVVYDDIALDVGHLRFRKKGSHGGQNGMRSIISHLGSSEFNRLRLGVGKVTSDKLIGHVLGKFSVNERESAENMLATAANAVQFSLTYGVEAAANQFNTPKQSLNTQE